MDNFNYIDHTATPHTSKAATPDLPERIRAAYGLITANPDVIINTPISTKILQNSGLFPNLISNYVIFNITTKKSFTLHKPKIKIGILNK